ncbi:hypothetical protein CQ10_33735 [Bradyrhizobium valentinum]|uniref:Uncharacterized protein n=1 Tax=Bradyrhizobium valentinum TaxID=1518501 RepID=A0A0R3LIF5_9BRAD|nr:hypothetical protein CQ10_33735 [Bradyrhizobium valentinum]KRR07561.1 hypothetical protein CP49_35030 [Bradyrhizobium valentinum]
MRKFELGPTSDVQSLDGMSRCERDSYPGDAVLIAPMQPNSLQTGIFRKFVTLTSRFRISLSAAKSKPPKQIVLWQRRSVAAFPIMTEPTISHSILCMSQFKSSAENSAIAPLLRHELQRALPRGDAFLLGVRLGCPDETSP